MQVLANFWEAITQANTNQIIAAFTIVIGVTTIVYTLMTLRLFRLTRWAFLVDVLIRITQPTSERRDRHLRQMMGEASKLIAQLEGLSTESRRKARLDWELLTSEMDTEPYLMGLVGAIRSINKKLGVNLTEAIAHYLKEEVEAKEDVTSKIESFQNDLAKLEET